MCKYQGLHDWLLQSRMTPNLLYEDPGPFGRVRLGHDIFIIFFVCCQLTITAVLITSFVFYMYLFVVSLINLLIPSWGVLYCYALYITARLLMGLSYGLYHLSMVELSRSYLLLSPKSPGLTAYST